MAKVLDNPRPTLKERAAQLGNQVQGSQAWNAIFRPGSIFRKGYTDSPRNRSYVIMNSVASASSCSFCSLLQAFS
jgi:hypothetical protein